MTTAAKLRYAVRKLDFGRGYVIVATSNEREIPRTWNTHRKPVVEHCERMNARMRIPKAICPACTGSGFDSTDPEDSSACLDCNGSGEING
jgi:DnaJ-class molecular chaperone